MAKPSVARVELAKAVIVTAEVMGHELTEHAAEAMADELAEHPPQLVAKALKRCQRELQGRLTLAAILDRVDNGHPGPEEAWALCPRDEDATVVWTDEIAEAFGVARQLLQTDEVAARMAFKETYARLLQEARNDRRPAKWTVSMGCSPSGRVEAVMHALGRGRLSLEYARNVVHPGLPDYERYAARLGAGEKVDGDPIAALGKAVGA